jgi:hypothetical protein
MLRAIVSATEMAFDGKREVSFAPFGILVATARKDFEKCFQQQEEWMGIPRGLR